MTKFYDLCQVCGRPEKTRYKPREDRTFTCSICVHNMLMRNAKEAEEKQKNKIKRPKRRKRR